MAVMKHCPGCSGALEAGYLAAPTYLNWVERPAQGGWFDGSPFKEDKLVTFREAFAVGPRVSAYVPGLRCRKCNLVLMDFSRT